MTIWRHKCLINYDEIGTTKKVTWRLIEPLFNKSNALRNMNDDNPLCHNDGKWRHQIVTFVKVINDAAPC